MYAAGKTCSAQETVAAPASTVSYAYTNSAWGDQLTEYDGQTIVYDSMGNPTTYRGYTMAWRGKQLTSASNGTDTLSFEYNEDGLRQKTTVNNVDTDYYYNGSVLIGMQRGTDKLLFSYDAAGDVVSVKYITANDTNEYYYLRNAQNDVVKLIDASGNTVVEYTYDTWGKKVTTTGTLAGTLGLIQPFRYRGYVYDFETGLYYLQSRYYDPTTGRFISADILLSTGQGVMGHNAYAYCLGNPVNMVDAVGASARDLALVSEKGGGGYVPWLPLEQRYYSSPDEAARAWAKEWRNTDSLYEYGAIIFEAIIDGQTYYRVGRTRRGDKTRSERRLANVINTVLLGVVFDLDSYCNETPYALIHTHPLNNGQPSRAMSKQDIKCAERGYPLVDLQRVYMVPYGGEKHLYRHIRGEDGITDINE